MRLATITNWAYGATVALTVASGTTMLLASHAYEQEQAAVEQRYRLDKASESLAAEIFQSTDHARQFLNTGDPTYGILYNRDVAAQRSIDSRIERVQDLGASADEISALKAAVSWARTLQDEQAAAVTFHARGDEQRARRLLFGAEYERDLDRARIMIERFQDRLDQRTEVQVAAAGKLSRLWKSISEMTLGATGLLFLCVLSFVFKRRVLRPVLRLSDVIGRLAAQDYAVEPPRSTRSTRSATWRRRSAYFGRTGWSGSAWRRSARPILPCAICFPG